MASRNAKWFSAAWKFIRKNEILQLSIVILATVNVMAFPVWLFEQQKNAGQFHSFGDSLWWALVTIATVGYGDKVPVTLGGRIIGSIAIISGLVLISLFTATVSSLFVARRIKESQGLQDISFSDHIVVCGWNSHVEDILQTFRRHDRQPSSLKVVLANDTAPELMEAVIETYPELDLKFVRGDYAREAVLNRANIKSAQAAIIVPDHGTEAGIAADNKTLLCLLTMKSLNPALKVYAHIINKDNLQHFKRANADEVIVSDQYVGFFLANHIIAPGAPQTAMEILDNQSGNDFHRVAIPPEFVGKNFGELLIHLKKDHNWTLVGVVKEHESVHLNDILSDDTSAIDAFIQRKFKEAGINVAEKAGVQTTVNPPFDYKIQSKDIAVIIGTTSSEKA
ncbi:MAG: NAD-binding protein [Ignavibacteriales bacterium]|nr:NAD-binding protein [Ignavibacteriales bacterium]